MTLDYKKMVEDIDDLVQTDFVFNMMDARFVPHVVKFTQQEAKDMAHLIGMIYSISHCTTCKA